MNPCDMIGASRAGHHAMQTAKDFWCSDVERFAEVREPNHSPAMASELHMAVGRFRILTEALAHYSGATRSC